MSRSSFDRLRTNGNLRQATRERIAAFGGVVVLGFLAGLALMWAFAKVADEVLGQETAALDATIATFILSFSSPEMTVVMKATSFMGSQTVWIIGAVLLIFFAWQRRWGAALILVFVAGGAQLLNNLLKSAFHRTRPMPIGAVLIAVQQYSFPSGHAMLSSAFYLYLTYLTWRFMRGWKRVALITLLAVLVLLIGISRIYLQAHYFTDVLAGYLAGLLWTDAVILGSRVLMTRRQRRRQPVP